METKDYSKLAIPVFNQNEKPSDDLCVLYALKTVLTVHLRETALENGDKLPETDILEELTLSHRASEHISEEQTKNPKPTLARGLDPESFLLHLDKLIICSSKGSYVGVLGETYVAQELEERKLLVEYGPCIGFVDTSGFALHPSREHQAATHAVAIIGFTGEGWIIQDSVGDPHQSLVRFGEQGIDIKNFYKPDVNWTKCIEGNHGLSAKS